MTMALSSSREHDLSNFRQTRIHFGPEVLNSYDFKICQNSVSS